MLVLYDCCNSATTSYRIYTPLPNGTVTKFIGASGFDAKAPLPGQNSFSNALIAVLTENSNRELAVGEPLLWFWLNSESIGRMEGMLPAHFTPPFPKTEPEKLSFQSTDHEISTRITTMNTRSERVDASGCGLELGRGRYKGWQRTVFSTISPKIWGNAWVSGTIEKGRERRDGVRENDWNQGGGECEIVYLLYHYSFQNKFSSLSSHTGGLNISISSNIGSHGCAFARSEAWSTVNIDTPVLNHESLVQTTMSRPTKRTSSSTLNIYHCGYLNYKIFAIDLERSTQDW